MRMPDRCPFCKGKLEVTGWRCSSCGVEVRGRFSLPPSFELDEQEWEFVKLFLEVRGNLSELAKILGISYPTVRARLDEIRKKLGLSPQPKTKREEILEMLERGEISVEEALEKLKET